MIRNRKTQLVVALDVDNFKEAVGLIDLLGNHVDIFKVGSQLFTICGPMIVRYIQSQGKKVFLDLKFHDIPNTVGSAIASCVDLSLPAYNDVVKKGKDYQSLFMCNVHTMGGLEMMTKAVEMAAQRAQAIKVSKPLIIGVTVLTSDAKTENIEKIVLERATLAKKAGLDGVVASVHEAALIRKELGEDFVIVTPGIRPAGSSVNDQKRVATPKDAVKSGTDFIVVGRPVIEAQRPVEVVQNILKDLS